jgi:hypothetical protein
MTNPAAQAPGPRAQAPDKACGGGAGKSEHPAKLNAAKKPQIGRGLAQRKIICQRRNRNG